MRVTFVILVMYGIKNKVELCITKFSTNSLICIENIVTLLYNKSIEIS